MLGKRGSVMLFLRRLPNGVTKKELKDLVRRSVKEIGGRSFAAKKSVGICTIMCISDIERGTREFHGLVQVRPAAAAMLAIEALNRKMLKGRLVEVHRYRYRYPIQANNLGDASCVPGGAQVERRRRNIKLDLVTISGNATSESSWPATNAQPLEGESDPSLHPL